MLDAKYKDISTSLPILKSKIDETLRRGHLIETQNDHEGNNLIYLAIVHDLYEEFISLFIRMVVMSEGQYNIDNIQPNKAGIHPMDLILDSGNFLFLEIVRRFQIYREKSKFYTSVKPVVQYKHWTLSSDFNRINSIDSTDNTSSTSNRLNIRKNSRSSSASYGQVHLMSPAIYEAELSNTSNLLEFKLPTIIDDYFSYSDELKNNDKEAFIKALSSEQSFYHDRVSTLNTQAQQIRVNLKAVWKRLQNREHEICLSVWKSVERERVYRKQVEKMSEAIDRIKQNIERCKSSLRWEGLVEVRQYKGLVLQIWKPMLCTIESRIMTLYPCSIKDNNQQTFNDIDSSDKMGVSLDEMHDDDSCSDSESHPGYRSTIGTDISDTASRTLSKAFYDQFEKHTSNLQRIVSLKKNVNIKSYCIEDFIDIQVSSNNRPELSQNQQMSSSHDESSIFNGLSSFMSSSNSSLVDRMFGNQLLSKQRSMQYHELKISVKETSESLSPGSSSLMTQIHMRIFDLDNETMLSVSNQKLKRVQGKPTALSSSIHTGTTWSSSTTIDQLGYSCPSSSTLAQLSYLKRYQSKPLQLIQSSDQDDKHVANTSTIQGYISTVQAITDEVKVHYQSDSQKSSSFAESPPVTARSVQGFTSIPIPIASSNIRNGNSNQSQLMRNVTIYQNRSDEDIGADDGIKLEVSFRNSIPATAIEDLNEVNERVSDKVSLARITEGSRYSKSLTDTASRRGSSGQFWLNSATETSSASSRLAYDMDDAKPPRKSENHSPRPDAYPIAPLQRVSLTNVKAAPKPLSYDDSSLTKDAISDDDDYDDGFVIPLTQSPSPSDVSRLNDKLKSLKADRSRIIHVDLVDLISYRETSFEYVRYLQNLRKVIQRRLEISPEPSSPLSSPTKKNVPVLLSPSRTSSGFSVPPEALLPEFHSVVSLLEEQLRVEMNIFTSEQRIRDISDIINELSTETLDFSRTRYSVQGKPKEVELYDIPL